MNAKERNLKKIKKGGELADQRKEKLEDVLFDLDWSKQLLKDFYDIGSGTKVEDFIMDGLNKVTKLKCDHRKNKSKYDK